MDLHTGLGDRGAAEPIFRGGFDPDAVDRARRWYGDALTLSEAGTASSTPIIGNTARGLAEALGPDVTLTAITLECGTVPGVAARAALRADNGVRLQAGPEPADRVAAATEMTEAFWPTDPAWRRAVWTRARDVIGQAVRRLTS